MAHFFSMRMTGGHIGLGQQMMSFKHWPEQTESKDYNQKRNYNSIFFLTIQIIHIPIYIERAQMLMILLPTAPSMFQNQKGNMEA